MPKIVTIRAVVDDDKVDDYIKEASNCLESSTIDYVAETHVMPSFMRDNVVIGGYVKGDFLRDLHYGERIPDAFKNQYTMWDSYGMDHPGTKVRYKYDTVPQQKDNAIVVFAPEE